MKLDEFAFVNQQLAGMLRSGIPLEGALRRTCEGLRDGPLRVELAGLESDLVRGVPLGQAVAARRLPEFYARMLQIGARGRDLPALLTLLADYYQRAHLVWVRLKGLLFYPVTVLVVSFAVSLLMAIIFTRFGLEMRTSVVEMAGVPASVPARWVYVQAGLWLPVVALGLLTATAGAGLIVPAWRERLRWRLPGFREARWSNVASSLALLMENGSSVSEAMGLVSRLEGDSPAGRDVAGWERRLAEGRVRFDEVAAGGEAVPPLFIWLVAASGENWVDGFRQAAEVYRERAVQRAELALYAVLPVSVVALGGVILLQLLPMVRVFGGFARSLLNFDTGQ